MRNKNIVSRNRGSNRNSKKISKVAVVITTKYGMVVAANKIM